MNRLRLAEPGYLSSPMNLSSPGMLSDFDISEYYLNVPTDSGEIVKVREDVLDQYDDEEFSAIMDILEPYQERTMSGLFSGIRERMATRREERKENRAERQATREVRRDKRREAIGNIVGKITDVFKPQQEPMYKELDITGGIGLDYNQPTAQGSNTKTALIIGGSALALILLYKMMKK